MTPQFPQVGQNLAQMGSSAQSSSIDWNGLVAMWYNEVNLFGGSAPINSYSFNEATGHYTQLAWANSYAVGCGFIQYYNGGWYWNYLVCNYGPAGNVIGQPMYSVGSPSCQTSSQYPYLCVN